MYLWVNISISNVSVIFYLGVASLWVHTQIDKQQYSRKAKVFQISSINIFFISKQMHLHVSSCISLYTSTESERLLAKLSNVCMCTHIHTAKTCPFPHLKDSNNSLWVVSKDWDLSRYARVLRREVCIAWQSIFFIVHSPHNPPSHCFICIHFNFKLPSHDFFNSAETITEPMKVLEKKLWQNVKINSFPLLVILKKKGMCKCTQLLSLSFAFSHSCAFPSFPQTSTVPMDFFLFGLHFWNYIFGTNILLLLNPICFYS